MDDGNVLQVGSRVHGDTDRSTGTRFNGKQRLGLGQSTDTYAQAFSVLHDFERAETLYGIDDAVDNSVLTGIEVHQRFERAALVRRHMRGKVKRRCHRSALESSKSG